MVVGWKLGNGPKCGGGFQIRLLWWSVSQHTELVCDLEVATRYPGLWNWEEGDSPISKQPEFI